MQKIWMILIISAPGGLAQLTFPEWRGSNVLPVGVWNESSVVAVGEVVDVHAYGEQEVESLPWPMSPGVHKLYWCEGNFRAIAVVKGEFSSPAKKYLWASPSPGCALWDNDPRLMWSRFKTSVWFLREERGFLRPPFDGGTTRFEGFFTQWDQRSRVSAGRQFGALLLTPDAHSDTLRNYANYLWDVGDIACDVLGKAECAQQIRALAELGNPALRENACHFLKGQLGEDCSAK